MQKVVGSNPISRLRIPGPKFGIPRFMSGAFGGVGEIVPNGKRACRVLCRGAPLLLNRYRGI